MFTRIIGRSSLAVLAFAFLLSAHASPQADAAQQGVPADGIVKIRSVYGMAETIARLKQDIADKGIMFFTEVDQSTLAANAGIALRPSTLLVFGNPPLGSQFMTSNPLAGLDWPVRLLVLEDAEGQVWAAYTDFGYIAHRHGITDRDAQFKMAAEVIASITASVAAK
jgi:uncharacterized protein (DUF302 family)